MEAAGGIPVILPVLPSPRIPELGRRLDGILLAGGVDVDPGLYGEEPLPGLGAVTPERDAFELALVRWAWEEGLPLLGICRGIQVLNVAAGGTLFQDLSSQLSSGLLKHEQKAPRWHETHLVRVAGGSRLARILGREELRVNSFHHQAVREVAPGWRAVAWAPDGVIEGIESSEHPFALGVQWHAEGMWDRHPLHLRLFVALVEAAREKGGART